MTRICIAVADAARARLYTFEQLADPTGAAQELRECVDLIDPDRRRRPRRAGSSLFDGELAIDEIDRDLTKFSSAHIHDLLADKGLLPARSRVASSRP
jgi:hypothetical protein